MIRSKCKLIITSSRQNKITFTTLKVMQFLNNINANQAKQTERPVKRKQSKIRINKDGLKP